MLHVLLILLKIIGIILALALCLIILILAVPIRYSFRLEKKEEEAFQGRIKVTWFWALLYVKVSYIESVFDYRVRIAGHQILGNQESFLKRKDEREKKKEEKQKKKDERGKKKEERQKKKEEEQKQKKESAKEKDNQKEELAAQAIPGTAERLDPDCDVRTAGRRPESPKTQKKEHSGKADLKKLYTEYHGEELLRIAKESIIKIIRHILPQRLKGNLRFGFDDPAATGILTGAAAIFYPKYQNHFQLEPDFRESCFEADCEGRGRIRLGFFLILAIRLLLSPDVRKCMKRVLVR